MRAINISGDPSLLGIGEARLTVMDCCCLRSQGQPKGDPAEFPCCDCPVHPDALMAQPGFGCKRHGHAKR